MGFDTKNIVDNFKDNVSLDILGVVNRDIKSIKPQKTYMWDITVTNGGIVPVLGSLLDEIKVYGKSVTMPNSAIDPIQFTHMGERVFYAGKESSTHQCQITFWDDEKATIRRYMDDWYQTMHKNFSGNSVHKVNYERELKINLNDTTDSTVTSIMTLYGVFPIEISEIPLSYDNSEVLEVSVTFQYDSKKMTT